MHNLGCLAFDQEDYAAARDWLTQGLTWRSAYDNLGFVHALAEFATLAAAEGLPETALRLAGATAALTQRTGIVVQHSELGRYEGWLATARQALREEVAAAAWAEGHQMRLDQAVAYALMPHEIVAASTRTEPRPAQTFGQLTLRQREVAALIAQGRSNRQIGEALVITQRTVAAHIEHILNKLDFVSRTQIGVWAAAHGLVVSSVA